MVYYAEGEVDRAIEDWNKVIELQLDYAEAYYHRGEAWVRLQEWEKARLDLTVAKVIENENIASLRRANGDAEDFAKKYGGQMPDDIVALLMPAQV